MINHDEYDQAYAQLVELCEQHDAMPDAALLCVMEAFNILAEYRAPHALPDNSDRSSIVGLRDVAEFLARLASDSQNLSEVLLFTRAHDLVEAAFGQQR